MLYLFKRFVFLCLFVLSFSLFNLAQTINSPIKTTFDEDTKKTTVFLRGVELPQNKDKFAVGAFFEFPGETLKEPPCCAGIFFTLISRKKFKFKENHNLIIWADREKFTFDKVNWQESAEGTAFILARIAFPEELFVGMKTDIFRKIANAKKVKMQLGSFKFSLTLEHLSGFKNLIEKMNT